MESPSMSYISRLHEYQLKNPCTVEYEEGFTGLSHDKTFTMRAIVNGQRFPDGIGKTKQDARQNAAKNALDGLKSSASLSALPVSQSTTSSVQSISNHMPISQPKYTSWLNDYSQKNKLVFEARETTKMDSGNSALLYIYVCKFVCGDREFPEAYGNTKREAREAASSRVYEELCKTQNTEKKEIHTGLKQHEDERSSQSRSRLQEMEILPSEVTDPVIKQSSNIQCLNHKPSVAENESYSKK